MATFIGIVIGCIVIAVLLAFHTYCTKVYQSLNEHSNSISIPPEFPQVTPPVIVEQVQLGAGTYFDIDNPENIITVWSVWDGVVSFDTNSNCYLTTLPTADFLLKYTLREQTTISKL